MKKIVPVSLIFVCGAGLIQLDTFGLSPNVHVATQTFCALSEEGVGSDCSEIAEAKKPTVKNDPGVCTNSNIGSPCKLEGVDGTCQIIDGAPTCALNTCPRDKYMRIFKQGDKLLPKGACLTKGEIKQYESDLCKCDKLNCKPHQECLPNFMNVDDYPNKNKLSYSLKSGTMVYDSCVCQNKTCDGLFPDTNSEAYKCCESDEAEVVFKQNSAEFDECKCNDDAKIWNSEQFKCEEPNKGVVCQEGCKLIKLRYVNCKEGTKLQEMTITLNSAPSGISSASSADDIIKFVNSDRGALMLIEAKCKTEQICEDDCDVKAYTETEAKQYQQQSSAAAERQNVNNKEETRDEENEDELIKKAHNRLAEFFRKLDSDRSVWKNADGSFNGVRLASDLTAGVVLGTVGGVVSGVLIKKSQVEKGFDALNCTVGGQKIADWGDEFTVGLRR